ncbi:hypothetical protein IVG45_00645 [Methylomonas sp. LL1]|uniref:hypothetical protein n=1 Tax=Methylomonas sp. LL1 TaxID=2785785 RepID=UPI0018C3ED1A|nr:hypothetical protein [Methylomonas sp. LL1]QPK63527.1 hypothetical protein IVG45_00645 [Methylomonas sp. LL1]
MNESEVLDDFKIEIERAKTIADELLPNLFGNITREEVFDFIIDWIRLADKTESAEINTPEKYDLAMAMLLLSAADAAHKKGKLAIFQLSGAMFCLGGSRRTLESNIKLSEQAKRNALKRHAENHAIKADALKYYSENIDKFKSKDSAAEAIAGNVVPASFRAVRKWLTEYDKKQRSAGTE